MSNTVREIIELKPIADAMGFTYSIDDEGRQVVEIGEADWDNTGREMNLIIKLTHGALYDRWQLNGLREHELTIICRQILGKYNMSAILTNAQAWSFFAGLALIKKDIKAWRMNYMSAENNRETEKILDILD
jgi:hypothetical protein